MNRQQSLNTIFGGDGWDEFQANEIAVDRALEYLIQDRI